MILWEIAITLLYKSYGPPTFFQPPVLVLYPASAWTARSRSDALLVRTPEQSKALRVFQLEELEQHSLVCDLCRDRRATVIDVDRPAVECSRCARRHR